MTYNRVNNASNPWDLQCKMPNMCYIKQRYTTQDTVYRTPALTGEEFLMWNSAVDVTGNARRTVGARGKSIMTATVGVSQVQRAGARVAQDEKQMIGNQALGVDKVVCCVVSGLCCGH